MRKPYLYIHIYLHVHIAVFICGVFLLNIDGPSASLFGAGLPPVPNQLVKQIQNYEFIDMSELTIDRLSMSSLEETSKPSHSKRWPVNSIIEWTQCFTNYITILGQAQCERISDLLGYQHLILEAHPEYAGDRWVVYMITASTRLLLPAWVPLGHVGMGTCGTWPLQAANAGPIASTVLAPPIPQRSAAGPQTPLPVKGKHLHSNLENWGVELHTVFISRLSVHPCLSDLSQ